MRKSLYALALLAAAPLAHADFTNGSFELPSIGGATWMKVYGSDVPGWTIEAGALVSNGFDGSDSGTTWHDTPSGSQYLYVNDSVGTETAFQSTLLGAGTHTLSFLQADFASDFETTGGEIMVSITRDSDSLSIVDPIEFDVPQYSSFVRQSLSFTAPTAGAYTFAFQGVGGHAALLDDVRLDPVPEPASLTALGLGAVAVLRRRKAA